MKVRKGKHRANVADLFAFAARRQFFMVKLECLRQTLVQQCGDADVIRPDDFFYLVHRQQEAFRFGPRGGKEPAFYRPRTGKAANEAEGNYRCFRR